PGPFASMSTVWAWKRSAVYSIHCNKPQYFCVRFDVLGDGGAVEGKPLPPRRHQHNLRDVALVALETSPHRTRGRVVLCLLGEGPIDADDDVIAGGKLVVGIFPNLPPVTLEDASFVRHRHLLKSSAREVRAEFSLDARDFPRAKPLGPHQRAFA